ncbi:MAG: tyrosine-type recombinase/integrase [Candidatus Accumulibacter meliphilus]
MSARHWLSTCITRAPLAPPGECSSACERRAADLLSSAAICTIVRRALANAGLNPAHKGAHLLRHSVATQMLRQGASLTEIGEILRHRNPQTTMIYAKVDLDLLRPLALPWPGGAQ